MVNQGVRVSALNSTSTLSTDDLSLETVVDELSETGYTSKKITEGAKASQYLEAFTYSNLNTTAKTIIGAINEAAESGGAGAFVIHWGASITETGPDIWAAYEGGEVLIIELGSASPFDYLELTKVYVESSYINLSFNGIDDGGFYVRAQIILNPSTKAIIDSSFLRGGVLGQIDDTTTASGKVWSSSKIAGEIAKFDYDEITQTLTAGNTTVSFTGAGSINGTVLTGAMTVEFFCDVFGLNPTAAGWTVDSGTGNDVLTLTFEAQASDVSVKVRFS